LEDRGFVMLDAPILSNEKTMKLYEQIGIPYEIWDSNTLKKRMPGINAGK
jgi:hypothetical protein